MKAFLKRGLLFILGIFLFLLVSLGMFAFFVPPNVDGPEETVTMLISPNETGASIAEDLAAKQLIVSPDLFRLAIKVTGTESKLQAGFYRIPNRSSLYQVIQLLQEGHVKSIRVTIPEGFTITQIAERLEHDQVVSKEAFLKEAETYVPYNYMYGPQPVKYHVEGFLFPETYDIPVNSTPKAIIDLMTKQMDQKLTPQVREQIGAMHLSIYQFVTLASIVEREALFDKDRPVIAGVFLKRLAIQMPLQSCATIEYLFGKRKPILSEEDVKIPSPYNTYLHQGLPPGPIANPGWKSMEAVLHATKTDYLYFVSDPEGHQHFSKTYEEHLQVVHQLYGN